MKKKKNIKDVVHYNKKNRQCASRLHTQTFKKNAGKIKDDLKGKIVKIY